MTPDANQLPTRIMIVDDDPVSRATMAAILMPEGCTVHVLAHGQELLEELARFKPDVLLLDVIMPGTNGFELCRRIKTDIHWQHLPIILVTSLNSEAELIKGLDAGADEFISKPVSAATLRARVRSMRRVKQRADLLMGIARMREDLAHMVIHDMRTPVAVGLLRIEALFRDLKRSGVELPPGASRYTIKESLQIVRQQLDRVNGQIDEILVMASTEEDRLVLSLEPGDLGEIANKVAEEQRQLAARSKIQLQVVVPAAGCQKMLDINLVNRLISNLVSNALKFAPENSTVAIAVSEADENGMYTVQVMDEGPGVPAGDRARIFERYAVAKVKNATGRNFGLGLAFCKMVAEAHGGSIRVEDNQPTGAVFTFLI